MTKPKIKAKSPHFYARGAALTTDQEDDLLGLLGIDEDDYETPELPLLDIKILLGCYHGGLQDVVDNAPKPADYVATLSPLRKDAYTLLNKIADLSYYMTEALEAEGIDPDETAHALARFVDVCGKINAKYAPKTKKSFAAKTNKALQILVNQLREVFKKYNQFPYDEVEEKEPYKGNVLSGYERDEHAFIKECLEMGAVKQPKNLRPLYYSEVDSQEKKTYIRQC